MSNTRLSVKAVAAIAAFALALRIVYLLQLEGSPLLSVLMGDARVYDEWAWRIAGGDWLGAEVFYQTPLYPYVLGAVYAIAGHDPAAVRVIQAVLGAASCALLAVAGARFFTARDGIAAALLLAIYPPAIFFDGLIQKSSLDVFLIAAILALLGEFQARRRRSWLIAAAAATGALVLNRENAFVLFAVVPVWLFLAFTDVPRRTRAALALAFVGAGFLTLLPVGARNAYVGGEFVLSTAQLGPNFYIGNHPHASGSYESLLPGRGDPIYERTDAAALASQAAGRTLSAGEVSRYWLRRSFDYIRAEPLDWLRLSGRKLLLTLNAAEISDTESIEAYTDAASLLRALSWLDFGVVLPLAALGAWLCRHRWRQQLLLYLMAGGLIVAVAAFFVVARYRHPIAPIVILFAGAGLGGLLQIRGLTRGWLPAVAAAGVVALVAHLPMTVVHDQTSLNLGSHFLDQGKPQEALPLLTKAVTVDPQDPVARAQLGLAWVQLGRPRDAIPHLREASRLQPDSADMHSNLALALVEDRPTDYGEALEHFREAVRLKPDRYTTRMNYGGGLCAAGRLDECLAQYEEGARLNPSSPDPPYYAARVYAQAGRLEDALASLEKAHAIAVSAGQADRAQELAEIIRQTKAAIGR